jgi:Tetratricopeptide repeat.
MSAILDQGSLLFASLAVLAVSLLLAARSGHAPPWFSFTFYAPLLVLAVVYVPGTLLLSKLLAGLGGTLGTVFQRDFSPLLVCAGMAWAAANLPLALAGWLLPASVFGAALAVAYFYFAVLMYLAVRTVFGTEDRTAVAVVCLSWVPLAAAVLLWGPLRFLLGWIASPFFLFYAYYYLGGEARALGDGLRSRQNFRRMLDAAAVNPHDAEAQYQLGLIYQQRHQYTEAIQRFQAAIAINPAETDAHFQLGRIAREHCGSKTPWRASRRCLTRTQSTAKARSCVSSARCTSLHGSMKMPLANSRDMPSGGRTIRKDSSTSGKR